MTRDERREALVIFLSTIQRPAEPVGRVADDLNLVDAGILDSLAILRIVVYLENEHGVDLLARGIDASQLTSIAAILDAIDA